MEKIYCYYNKKLNQYCWRKETFRQYWGGFNEGIPTSTPHGWLFICLYREKPPHIINKISDLLKKSSKKW